VTPVPPGPDTAGCPRCGSHARPGAQWCTLCYADLRPPPVIPRRAERAEPAERELVTVPPAPGKGKHARRGAAAEERTAEPDPGLRAEAMLALLAAETGNPLGGLTGRFESTGSRIGLMVGGVVVVAGVLFLLMLVIGSLL